MIKWMKWECMSVAPVHTRVCVKCKILKETLRTVYCDTFTSLSAKCFSETSRFLSVAPVACMSSPMMAAG